MIFAPALSLYKIGLLEAERISSTPKITLSFCPRKRVAAFGIGQSHYTIRRSEKISMFTDILDGFGMDTNTIAAAIYRKLHSFADDQLRLKSQDKKSSDADRSRFTADVKCGLLLEILLMRILLNQHYLERHQLLALIQIEGGGAESLQHQKGKADQDISLFAGRDSCRDGNSPRSVSEILGDKDYLMRLRTHLAGIADLRQLITNPPAILLDKKQQLFFYRGIQIRLQPACFNCVLILAENAGQVVLRDEIYKRLWPGEMNYDGTNKPYERQISDHKRRLINQIREGLKGRIDDQSNELEKIVITRPKVGYMLNVKKDDVLILS